MLYHWRHLGNPVYNSTQSLIKWAGIQVRNPSFVQKLSFPHLLGHPVYLWSLDYSNPEVLENYSYLKIVAHELST